MYLKLAWRNLWRNKRRTLITSASVFFAVLLAIFMKSLKEGTYHRMIDNMVGVYTGFIQIHQDGYWEEQVLDNSFVFTDSLRVLLSNPKNIKAFAPRVESFVLASSDAQTQGAMLVGIDAERENALTGLKNRVVEGDYFLSETSSVIIGDRLAEFLELKVNDTLIVLGQGFHGATAAGKYVVAGLVRFGSPELRKGIIYMPLQDAALLFDLENRLTSIAINLYDNPRATKDAAMLQRKLGSDYEVMPWQKLLPEMEQTIEWDRWEGYIFTAILYIIITFGIFGTLLMMMSERQHEFGVLVALGMRRTQIALTLSLEVAIITLLGTGAGILATLPFAIWFHRNPYYMSDGFSKMYEDYGFEAVLQASIEPGIFFYQGLSILILALIAALYPLIKILKMDSLQAMRS